MPSLRRHQLAHLTAQGWREVLAAPAARALGDLLRTWAARRLPLVVPRQPGTCRSDRIALAWSAPLAAGRARLLVEVPMRSVAYFDEFPDVRAAAPLLPRDGRSAAMALAGRLHAMGTRARVYGSYGWQVLSGEAYVRASSDLDVWVAVANHTQAAGVVRLLAAAGTLAGVRLDGELLFPDGAGVAWREYAAWRVGRARTVLVKRIDAVEMAAALDMPAWCEPVVA
jgi:phosphoribosyl-dephospho-CoA transferase